MKRISEAIDIGNFKDFINAQKRRRWESSTEAKEILGLLPDQAQHYFEMLLSKTYQKLMGRLTTYTGVPADRHDLGVVMQCMGAVQKCINIERNHKRDLESFALEYVLNLPEFEFVKQAHDEHMLEIDVRLSSGELEELIDRREEEIEEREEQAVDEEGNLTPGEEANFNVAEELFTDEEAALRRRLANTFTQGTAINGLYHFHIPEEQLKQITGEENIVKLYGMSSVAAQLGYFIAPPNIEGAAAGNGDSAGGSEEVEEVEGGKYRIKARGQIFPFLVHEIIKGFYEYLQLSQVTKKAEQAHGIQDETDDIVISELPTAIRQLVSEPKYLGIVKRKITELLDVDDIKDIIKGALSNPGSPEHTQAQRMVDEIVADIKKEYGHDEDAEGEE
jgi:hypothetical protein